MPAAPAITFTLDLEDDQGTYRSGGRFEVLAYRLLETLAQGGITGTVFAVGRVAECSPALLRHVVSLGHELACHSWDHTPLDRQGRDQFREHTAQAKGRLEQAGGAAIRGYRAPLFSMTTHTAWAAEELLALGFAYSSSVLPAHSPLYGMAGAPRHPFLWPCGLVEFPAPVAGAGAWGIPFLGGIYLRYLPLPLVLWRAGREPAAHSPWTYVHPYDFDTEPSAPQPGQPAWVNWLQRFNRKHTLAKLRALLAQGAGPPLGQIAADPTFLARLRATNDPHPSAAVHIAR
ncbi:MAG TPA: polysaccharide deacetylase family protein, partial [bacterium]|nr:polysaccharide deacetylase family protein [bacterium]